MSTNAVQSVEHAETYQQSLADRMAHGPLSLSEALRYATQIASALRDLHDQGLAYGAVSAQLILMGPSGAALRNNGRLKHLGDGHYDVTAFGAVLDEMLRRDERADGGLETLRQQARTLGRRCREESPHMQQVLISLRLLGLQARQRGAAIRPVRRPVLVCAPPAAAPVQRLQLTGRVRLRIHKALHWKPLASLAVFALAGK